MTTITEDLRGPGDTPTTVDRCEYVLVDDHDKPYRVFISGDTLVGPFTVYPDDDGQTTVELERNDLMDPPGTRWRLTRHSRSIRRIPPEYLYVDEDGTFRVDEKADLLPSTIVDPAVATIVAGQLTATFLGIVTDALAGKQDRDDDLVALAALTTTPFGISTLEWADSAAGRAALDVPSTGDLANEAAARGAADVALDGRLDTIEALGPLATLVDVANEATARSAADVALDGRLDTIEALGPLATAAALALKADKAGAAFTGTAPVAVDGVTAAALATLPNGTVNGFVVKVNGPAVGYGQGQAFMVVEEGVGAASDSTAAGSVLFRVDEKGGVGTNGGIHIATGFRKAVGGTQALWIQPYEDIVHIAGTRLAGSTKNFLQYTTDAGVKYLAVSPAGHLLVYGDNGTTGGVQLYAGDAGSFGVRALFATIAAATGGIAIQGVAGQTADLTQWLGGATVLAGVSADGRAYFGRTAMASGVTLIATPKTATDVGLAVRGVAGQTANLQLWQDSAAVVLASVSASGVLRFGSAADTNLYRSAADTLATDDDLSFVTVGKGPLIKSPNGNRWRITVDNAGALSAVAA